MRWRRAPPRGHRARDGDRGAPVSARSAVVGQGSADGCPALVAVERALGIGGGVHEGVPDRAQGARRGEVGRADRRPQAVVARGVRDVGDRSSQRCSGWWGVGRGERRCGGAEVWRASGAAPKIGRRRSWRGVSCPAPRRVAQEVTIFGAERCVETRTQPEQRCQAPAGAGPAGRSPASRASPPCQRYERARPPHRRRRDGDRTAPRPGHRLDPRTGFHVTERLDRGRGWTLGVEHLATEHRRAGTRDVVADGVGGGFDPHRRLHRCRTSGLVRQGSSRFGVTRSTRRSEPSVGARTRPRCSQEAAALSRGVDDEEAEAHLVAQAGDVGDGLGQDLPTDAPLSRSPFGRTDGGGGGRAIIAGVVGGHADAS